MLGYFCLILDRMSPKRLAAYVRTASVARMDPRMELMLEVVDGHAALREWRKS